MLFNEHSLFLPDSIKPVQSQDSDPASDLCSSLSICGFKVISLPSTIFSPTRGCLGYLTSVRILFYPGHGYSWMLIRSHCLIYASILWNLTMRRLKSKEQALNPWKRGKLSNPTSRAAPRDRPHEKPPFYLNKIHSISSFAASPGLCIRRSQVARRPWCLSGNMPFAARSIAMELIVFRHSL